MERVHVNIVPSDLFSGFTFVVLGFDNEDIAKMAVERNELRMRREYSEGIQGVHRSP